MWDLLQKEKDRQCRGLELIASEVNDSFKGQFIIPGHMVHLFPPNLNFRLGKQISGTSYKEGLYEDFNNNNVHLWLNFHIMMPWFFFKSKEDKEQQ